MGSAAIDKDGNLAVAYSVGSSSTFPSIRYAGRLAGDPPGGLFQGENTLLAGSGSQTGSNRWGDYSMLSVDPSDDCTFWFTTQYMPATDSSRWNTRIGSFRFGLAVSPSSLAVALNGTPYSQTITPTGGTGPFTFNITNGTLPNGLTLNTNTGSISGTPNDTDGVYNITIHIADTGNPGGCTGAADTSYELRLGCTYCDDFEDMTPPNWDEAKGAWLQTGGEYQGSGNTALSIATPSFAGCINCTVEADVRISPSAKGKVSVFGWYQSKSSNTEFLMEETKDKIQFIQRQSGLGSKKTKGALTLVANQTYHIKITFNGTSYQVFVDGNLIMTVAKISGFSPNGTVAFQTKKVTGNFGSILVY
jgi:hypothetical protein